MKINCRENKNNKPNKNTPVSKRKFLIKCLNLYKSKFQTIIQPVKLFSQVISTPSNTLNHHLTIALLLKSKIGALINLAILPCRLILLLVQVLNYLILMGVGQINFSLYGMALHIGTIYSIPFH